MDTYTIRTANKADSVALMKVWRRSVETSYTFLTPAAIDEIEPEGAKYMALCDVYVVETEGAPAGFMMLNDNMVEALFIDPDHMNKGLGTRLLEKAREVIGPKRPLRLDVNEQNPNGIRFYLARGFKQIGRSPVDSAGRPYPLLHMQQDGE